MAETREQYKKQHELITYRLNWVRNVNTLRRYVYTLSRDERNYFFTEVENYLRNVLTNNNLHITEAERNAITNLLGHWQITNVETNSTNWWSILLYNHSQCDTFLRIIKSYVPNIEVDSKDVSDNTSVSTIINMA